MSNNLRILHVVPHLGLGGVTSVVQELVRAQEQDSGLEIQLAVLESGGKRFPTFPTFSTKAPVHGFGFGGRLGDVNDVRDVARRLRELVVTWNPDIVHSHLWPAALITALAVRGLDTVHLDHVHDIRSWLSSPRLKNRLRRALHRRLFTRCPTHFVAVADAVRASLATHLRLPAHQITVVLNGVDPEAYRPSVRTRPAEAPLVIGTAGRYTAEKGHESLIRAVASLEQRGVAVECHLAGSGSLETSYRELIRQHGIAHRVTLRGELTDMASFYHELDAFVLPSIEAEGMPITVLEAMACGLPVISTRVGGVEEAIRDGTSGLVIPPRDDPALAAAVQKLAESQPLRASLGRAARERIVKTFTAARMAADVRSLYHQLAPTT